MSPTIRTSTKLRLSFLYSDDDEFKKPKTFFLLFISPVAVKTDALAGELQMIFYSLLLSSKKLGKDAYSKETGRGWGR